MTEVTRRQAAEILGYTHNSLSSMMGRHPDRWPEPVGRVRVGTGWAATYDLDEMRAAAGIGAVRPEHGRPFDGAATVSDDDGLITCAECGQRRRALWQHLRTLHDMTPAEYRAAHGLPPAAALTADPTRARARSRGRARAQAGDLDYLADYQTPEQSTAASQAGRDAVAAAWTSPIAAEHRRPGQARAISAMATARAARLDQQARTHGYDDLTHAVEDTRHLPARQAARMTGVSPQTITRRRAAP